MLHFSEVLTRLDHVHYISGQELADVNNVTRATIHNCIQKIAALGIEVDRVRGLGYRLKHPLDLLSKKDILNNLPDCVRNGCVETHCLQEVDSTNKFAASMDLPGVGSYSVVLSEMQTAGKGRRGREWVSPYAANLYLSIVWPLQRPLHEAGILSPMLALKILQCLESLGIPDLGIKWPNDIYWQDKKLAGILLELVGDAAGECAVVVGIGINVNLPNSAADNIDQPWVDIKTASGLNMDRSELVSKLLNKLLPMLASYEHKGFAAYRKEWQEKDFLADETVVVTMGANKTVGTARGVSERGALLLETNHGVQEIHGGEVSVRKSA